MPLIGVSVGESERDYAVAGICFYVLGAVSSTAALVASTVSWALIPKWRTFRNYVFLNIIITFVLMFYLPPILIKTSGFTTPYNFAYICVDLGMNFAMFAACCWLVVMAMISYTDIVTVFGSHVSRKFLKANIFAWGLPILITLVKVSTKFYLHEPGEINENDIFSDVFYYEDIGQNGMLILLLVSNFCVYIKVVYTLFKPSEVRRSVGNRWQKFQVATVAFAMSGVLLVISVTMAALMILGVNEYYLYPIALIATGIQTTVINMFTMLSKVNRDLWCKYYRDMKGRSGNLNDVGVKITSFKKRNIT